ncbi:AimR family lysis-lysogeny pheromone receptor [Pontibacillus salipaludis]|uniref:AimR family lysis-lysogeny pheromone receptor n=1 Tax=Pontibacillus salipaludis TaxID=1697394 RepID=UPI0031EC4366
MTAKAIINDLSSKNISLHMLKNTLYRIHGRDSALHILKEICLERKTPETRQHGMEFLFVNDLFTELKWLIHENKHSTDIMDRSWGQLYDVYLNYKLQKINVSEAFEHLNSIVLVTGEQECYVDLIQSILYFDSHRFSMFAVYIDRFKDKLSELEPSLLKDYLDLRHKYLLFRYHWRNNELIIARKYAFKLLQEDLSPERIGKIHSSLSLTYLFEGYEAAFYHIAEAQAVAEQYNISALKFALENHNIPFISAVNGRVEGISTLDSSEIAHLAIARGEKDKAISILERIQEPTPFQLYYLGLAKEDKSILLDSYFRFVNELSHYFFARLPLRAMSNLDMEIVQ